MSTQDLNQTIEQDAIHLLLASASPRRLALLEQINVIAQQLIVPSPEGEDEPRNPNETVIQYVKRTTDDKLTRALAYLNSLEHCAILTADTTVAMGDNILGKPTDRQDAIRMLSLLSGKTHDVYTAVNLYFKGQTTRALSHSQVTFDSMVIEQIEQYVDTNEPFGKAGAYAIQGMAAQHIQRLEGTYSGVMGLPLHETAQLLRNAGLIQ
jgi:septum formation protein|uniref:Maf family protein n=1 Tax=Orrella sp. TaxID=1921583 RepID=UPI004047D508